MSKHQILYEVWILTYPGFAIVSGCWVPRRRGFGRVGVDDDSATIFGFFTRLGDVVLLIEFESTVLSGLEFSGRALRLRDLGSG